MCFTYFSLPIIGCEISYYVERYWNIPNAYHIKNVWIAQWSALGTQMIRDKDYMVMVSANDLSIQYSSLMLNVRVWNRLLCRNSPWKYAAHLQENLCRRLLENLCWSVVSVKVLLWRAACLMHISSAIQHNWYVCVKIIRIKAIIISFNV